MASDQTLLTQELLKNYTGWLYKHTSSAVKTWVHRFFLIKDGVLFYGKSSGANGTRPYSSLVACKLEILDSKFKGRQNVFRLVFGGTSKTLTLSAESSVDLNAWKAAIRLNSALWSPVNGGQIQGNDDPLSSSVMSRHGEEDEWAAGTGPGVDIKKVWKPETGMEDDAGTEIIAREEEVPRGGSPMITLVRNRLNHQNSIRSRGDPFTDEASKINRFTGSPTEDKTHNDIAESEDETDEEIPAMGHPRTVLFKAHPTQIPNDTIHEGDNMSLCAEIETNPAVARHANEEMVHVMSAQLASFESERDSWKERERHLFDSVRAAEVKLKERKAALSATKKELARSNDELSSARRELSRLGDELAMAGQEQRRHRDEIAGARRERDDALTERNKLREKLEQQRGEMARATADRARHQREEDELTRVKTTAAEHSARVSFFETELSSLSLQLAEAQNTVATQGEELSACRMHISNLESALKEARSVTSLRRHQVAITSAKEDGEDAPRGWRAQVAAANRKIHELERKLLATEEEAADLRRELRNRPKGLAIEMPSHVAEAQRAKQSQMLLNLEKAFMEEKKEHESQIRELTLALRTCENELRHVRGKHILTQSAMTSNGKSVGVSYLVTNGLDSAPHGPSSGGDSHRNSPVFGSLVDGASRSSSQRASPTFANGNMFTTIRVDQSSGSSDTLVRTIGSQNAATFGLTDAVSPIPHLPINSTPLPSKESLKLQTEVLALTEKLRKFEAEKVASEKEMEEMRRRQEGMVSREVYECLREEVESAMLQAEDAKEAERRALAAAQELGEQLENARR